MDFPIANLEVKIVLPIPLRKSLLNARFRYVCILLRDSQKGLQDDNQAAHQEISPNVVDVQLCLV